MSSVIKWIKGNVFMLVCGAVVVLALVGWYLFLAGSWRDSLKTDMGARAALLGQIKSQEDVTVTLVPGQQEYKGPITRDMVKAKETVQKDIKKQADDIASEASDYNKTNRLSKDGVPLLDGQPRPFLLPVNVDKNKGDASNFKDAYLAVFDRWYADLVYGQGGVPAKPLAGNMIVPSLQALGGSGSFINGFPPSSAEVTAAMALNVHHNAPNAPTMLHGGAGGAMGAVSKNDEYNFTRAYISARDGAYRMYGTKDMFQIRPWAYGDNAPDEKAIFEAFVDVWVQQDLVGAVKTLNTGESVYQNPIKRVLRIAVGSTAGGTSVNGGAGVASDFAAPAGMLGAQGGGVTGPPAGEIFAGIQGAGGAVGSAPLPGAPAATPGRDYTRSMTGRVGTDRFDVTQFFIVLHIDPARLDEFINEIYKRNNGYTMLSVKLDAVDPFEAVSNGFIYGGEPVARVEIVGEAVFFRDWTKNVVPPVLRTLLTPPMDPLPTPAAPGAAGAAAPTNVAH